MSDEGFFKINQDTEFKFKDSYGFTFVDTNKLLNELGFNFGSFNPQ